MKPTQLFPHTDEELLRHAEKMEAVARHLADTITDVIPGTVLWRESYHRLVAQRQAKKVKVVRLGANGGDREAATKTMHSIT